MSQKKGIIVQTKQLHLIDASGTRSVIQMLSSGPLIPCRMPVKFSLPICLCINITSGEAVNRFFMTFDTCEFYAKIAKLLLFSFR